MSATARSVANRSGSSRSRKPRTTAAASTSSLSRILVESVPRTPEQVDAFLRSGRVSEAAELIGGRAAGVRRHATELVKSMASVVFHRGERLSDVDKAVLNVALARAFRFLRPFEGRRGANVTGAREEIAELLHEKAGARTARIWRSLEDPRKAEQFLEAVGRHLIAVGRLKEAFQTLTAARDHAFAEAVTQMSEDDAIRHGDGDVKRD